MSAFSFVKNFLIFPSNFLGKNFAVWEKVRTFVFRKETKLNAKQN